MTTRNVPLNAADAEKNGRKQPDALRMAQVGLAGGIGYSHINEVERNPRLIPHGAYDLYPNDPRVAAAIQRLRSLGAKIYATFDELLADPQVEAVDICTPHHFHRPMAVAAFKAGKHVLVEKPMATHPDDCEAMLAAQRASGKIGAVQMQQVGRQSMLKLRDAIQSGAIGKIREIFLSSLWWRTEDYYARIPWAGRMKIDGAWCVDGALYNQCVHYINQMLTLVSPGPLPSVATTKNLRCDMYKFHDAPNLEAGDTMFITAALESPDAPKITAICTTCSTEERHSIEILGEKGRAVWNGVGYLIPDDQPMTEFHDDPAEKPFTGNSLIFNSFFNAIRANSTPITSMQQIQNVTQFINNCYESANWQIKKAPWSATATLFKETIQQVRHHRRLPKDLPTPPSWA